jgi:hypothetical protein
MKKKKLHGQKENVYRVEIYLIVGELEIEFVINVKAAENIKTI